MTATTSDSTLGGASSAAAAASVASSGVDGHNSVVVAARETLCSLVQEYLTHLIREAATVRRHSSSSSSSSSLAPPLQVRHVNMVLQWRGQDVLYGLSSSSSSQNASATRDTTDKEGACVLDLNEYVRREMCWKPPCEVGMVTHWMAVNGKTTQLHQMVLQAAAVAAKRQEKEQAGGGEGDDDDDDDNAARRRRRGPKRLVSSLYQRDDDDDEDDKDGNKNSLELAARKLKVPKVDDSRSTVSSAMVASSPSLSVRQLLPRILSEELRLYFYRVTLAMEVPAEGQEDDDDEEEDDDEEDNDDDDDDEDRDDDVKKKSKNTALAAIRSVRRDVGLQELVPFFVKYIADEIMNAKRRCRSVRTILQLTLALLDNPHLHLELYLHQLLPVLITCVVAKRLNTFEEGEMDKDKDHHHHHHHHVGDKAEKDKMGVAAAVSSSSSATTTTNTTGTNTTSVATSTTTSATTANTTAVTTKNTTTTTTAANTSSTAAAHHATAKTTSSSSSSLSSTPSFHWFLRNDAAQILVKTTRLYGTQYPSLKARIIQTLCKGLYSEHAPLATQYGAIMALSEFGAKTIESFLLPVTWDFWHQWNAEDSYEVTQCQQAMLCAMNVLLLQQQEEVYQQKAEDSTTMNAPTATTMTSRSSSSTAAAAAATTSTAVATALSTDLEAIFGERLIPFNDQRVGLNYNGCFI